jgi:hypothetical protein
MPVLKEDGYGIISKNGHNKRAKLINYYGREDSLLC